MKNQSSRLRVFFLGAVFSVLSCTSAQAVIISNATPIPDSHVLINFNNTGLDWVYAGPIAPNEFGPGNIQQASYRAAEGWTNATLAQWAIKPAWQDFSIGAPPPASSGHTDHTTYRFASEYWGDFSHVDLNDAARGFITNGTDIGSLTDVYETWYVRVSRVQGTPDGGVSVALLGFALLGLVALRRKVAAA